MTGFASEVSVSSVEETVISELLVVVSPKLSVELLVLASEVDVSIVDDVAVVESVVSVVVLLVLVVDSVT
ncbi:hypothetical protein HSIEG1_3279 [Enterococcus sp. HSIEG1]|nr:hypothetical protein HSIEG1_3279 [Enterococcus sp. HSIEG1]